MAFKEHQVPVLFSLFVVGSLPLGELCVMAFHSELAHVFASSQIFGVSLGNTRSVRVRLYRECPTQVLPRVKEVLIYSFFHPTGQSHSLVRNES